MKLFQSMHLLFICVRNVFILYYIVFVFVYVYLFVFVFCITETEGKLSTLLAIITSLGPALLLAIIFGNCNPYSEESFF